MTQFETLYMIEMLVDDGMLEYAGDAEVLSTINEAQMTKLRDYYAQPDERAMRPFYKQSGFLDSGAAIADLLFVRAVRVYDTTTQADADSRTASYIDYGKFINYDSPGFGPGLAHIQTSHYTLYNGNLYFDKKASTQRAKVWYVRTPATFSTSQPLELPAEYHFEVVALAADMLNDMDVNEQERGVPAEQNQPLSIEAEGGI